MVKSRQCSSILLPDCLYFRSGHNYPITMKFSGGKGTASLVGVLLAVIGKLLLSVLEFPPIFSIATDYLVIGVLFM